MNRQKVIIIFILILISILSKPIKAQDFKWERVNFLIGNWVGNGTGVGIKSSEIAASYNYCLNDHFIEVNHHIERKTTNKKQPLEIRDDWGMISFDNQRGSITYRQFNANGSFIQYFLNDSLSTSETLVFESEILENYKINGKLRFTIKKISDIEIATYFDIKLPEKDFVMYEVNKLIKQE